MSSDLRETLTQVEGCIFNDDYDRAYELLDSLIEEQPTDPFGHLGRATAYLSEMTDCEDNLYPVIFSRTIDTVIALAQNRISDQRPNETAWMYLCIGHAKAYRSLWESRFGSFTSAIKLGFEARDAYEKGLASDSTVYDLYGGLGMYHYWKSAKAGILRWLGFFKNDKQKGVDELYLALDSSCLSQYSARHALVWIWLDMKDYDSAIAVCGELLEKFPNGKIFLWPLAAAYRETGDYDKALATYHLLRERLQKRVGNYYNLIECDYQLYGCYEKLGRSDEARQVVNTVNSYFDLIPQPTKQRQKSRLATLGRAVRF